MSSLVVGKANRNIISESRYRLVVRVILMLLVIKLVVTAGYTLWV